MFPSIPSGSLSFLNLETVDCSNTVVGSYFRKLNNFMTKLIYHGVCQGVGMVAFCLSSL